MSTKYTVNKHIFITMTPCILSHQRSVITLVAQFGSECDRCSVSSLSASNPIITVVLSGRLSQ